MSYFCQKGLDKVFEKGARMARIPQNELERLKTEVSVQRLVEARGVELKRMGKDLDRCQMIG